MMKNKSTKVVLTGLVTTLFILSSVTPITIGHTERTTVIQSDESTNENYVYNNFDIYHFPEYVAKERHPDLVYYQKDNFNTKKEAEEYSNNDYQKTIHESVTEKPTQSSDGPLDSPWPMYCHDSRHTGRSSYSTANNPGIEKWRFKTVGPIGGSPVIDNNGIIYIGATHFYAIYPNGTLKWKHDGLKIESAPAIDENGTIYVGTVWAMPNYLYAFYSNGTLKWKYTTGDDVKTSPVIGDDGTIYFAATDNWNIIALNPNGTQKWTYKTNHVIYSSPAIGPDGIVYCGSHDGYLYALYPNNGTLKWKFPTGNWVHGSPTIADDGTVYIGSDDGYLYALYPNNGTMKWKCSVGCMRASPALDEDGTLYFGVWEGRFYAIYPDGIVKWSFDLGEHNGVWGSSAAISTDGTIYFGMCYDMGSGSDGDIIALNPDGTEKWRKGIGRCHSSPAIGEDGTVYIGNYGDDGRLFAFGSPDPNAPDTPTINGLTNGIAGQSYEYTFTATDPNDDDVFYYIEWGDNTIKDWFGPFASGEEVTASHTWSSQGTYTIKARAKDTENLWGPWGTLTVTMPRNRAITNPLFLWFLERFPMLQRLLLNFR